MEDNRQVDLAPVVDVLVSRGWSVADGDEILGRQTHVLGDWNIGISRDGLVRFSATRLTSSTQRRRLQRSCRRYLLRLEAHSVLTVTARLSAAEDLPAMLDQLAAFAAGHDE